jgi:hypothetical protein
MRRPKGIKTRKSVSKRFKITGTGKVMRRGRGQAPFASRQEFKTPPVVAQGDACWSDRRLSYQTEFAIQPLKSFV